MNGVEIKRNRNVGITSTFKDYVSMLPWLTMSSEKCNREEC